MLELREFIDNHANNIAVGKNSGTYHPRGGFTYRVLQGIRDIEGRHAEF